MRFFCLSVAPHLDRTVVSDQLILHAVAPQSSFREVFQQVRVDNLQARPVRDSQSLSEMGRNHSAAHVQT